MSCRFRHLVFGENPNSSGACWRCATPRINTPLDSPIDKEAFQEYLVMVLITRKLSPSSLSLHKDCFLKALVEFETFKPNGDGEQRFGIRVFRSSNARTVRSRAKALILKCFASQILVPEIDGHHLRASLGYYDNGNPRMNHASSWEGFKFFDISSQ